MKKDYHQVKELRELSGFGWDSEKNMVTAHPESVWDDYAKVCLPVSLHLYSRAPSFNIYPLASYLCSSELSRRIRQRLASFVAGRGSNSLSSIALAS